MKTLPYKLTLMLALVLAVMLAPAAPVSAQGPDTGDKVIFGGSYTLPSGETLAGDLVVFGGAVDVQENAVVQGDVAVIGGSVDINGLVHGDVSVIGGSLDLGATAVVDGNAVNFGGAFHRHPDAVVSGDAINGWRLEPQGPETEDGIELPRIPPIEINPGDSPAIEIDTGPRTLGDWLAFLLLRLLAAVGWATLLGVLAVAALAVLPRHTERVVDTIQTNAVASFLVGVVVLLLAAPLFGLLAITICLAPLALVAGILLLAALLFGWIAAGWLLGKRILRGLKMTNGAPILEAVIGVVLLTLLWRLPLMAPCVGDVLHWVIGVVVGSIGLGAVILTRFGSQNYTGGSRALAPTPPPPAESLPLPPEL